MKRYTKLWFVLLTLVVLVTLSASSSFASTIYVSTTGNDNNNGSSWGLAKLHVQAGINAAGKKDEVWVSAGTYAERIVLKPDSQIYGGFAGGETTRDQRNPSENNTTIDAQQKGSAVRAPSASPNPALIDGFTITNGNASLGGGIFSGNKSCLIISNNTITGNTGTYGGAIYCDNRSTVKILNNKITRNKAAYGAGIACMSDSAPQIINNTIAENNTIGKSAKGGGICLVNSQAIITNNIIAYNNTYGIDAYGAQKPTLKNNNLYGNTTFNGQGIPNPVGINGNISADPLFKDKANGDYHIQKTSPCIDTGNDAAVGSDWKDMDWEARQENLPGIGTALVDIGADEYYYDDTPPTTPVVEDGGATTTDTTQLSASWTAEDPESGIVEVQYALGATPCGTEVLTWQTLPDPTQHDFTITGLSLQQNITYYISVKVKNEDDLWSEVGTSDGIKAVIAVRAATVKDALMLASGSIVTITKAVVTTDYNATKKDFVDGTAKVFYIGCADGIGRAYGLKIKYNGTPYVTRGNEVTITGTMEADDTAYKEAYINASSVGILSPSTPPLLPPNTVGMNNRTLGGGNLVDPISGNLKWGVNTPAGFGLYNKSILVRCWGTVKKVDAANKFFYIDDGSALNDTTGNGLGVKISYALQGPDGAPIIPPEVGWYVLVTGICSSETIPGDPSKIIRVVRPRTPADIISANPADTIAPTIAITKPLGDTIHKAASGVVPIGGTAWDAETKVKYVEVSTDGGVSYVGAIYDSGTCTWTYNGWTNPAAGVSYTIDARAFDYAGNMKQAARRTVTVVIIPSNTVIYVKPGGTRTTDIPTSWADAYGSVVLALSTATSGKEVWVAAGTYSGLATSVGSDSCIFQLKSGVGLYGGFAGDEIVRESRDWSENKTILQPIQKPTPETYTVVRVDNGAAANTTVIDGFTIQNGVGSCIVDECNSGGGIFCGLGSAPTIAHNIIINNDGYTGVGIYIYGNGASSPKIYGNTITNNTANTASAGGGIYCYASDARISNNIISNNIASCGAGLILGNSPSAKIVNNTFVGNNSAGGGMDGDAIYTFGSTGVSIANNIITRNGIGIRAVDDAQPILKNNCVYLNGYDETYDYVEWVEGTLDHPTDINIDPKLIWDNIHIQSSSPCIGTGYNDAVLSGDKDIDGEERKMPTGGVVDIGTDETVPGAVYYELELSANPPAVEIPGSSVVTAHVQNPVTVGPVSGYMVYIDSIEGLASVDDWDWESGSTGTKNGFSGFGNTNASGDLKFWVTRTTQGLVTVTCRIDMPYQLSVTREVYIWFYDPSVSGVDWPMFHFDQTLSGATPDGLPSSLVSVWNPVELESVAGGLPDGTTLLTSSPVVASGLIYVGTQSGKLYQIESDTGAIVSQTTLPDSGSPQPIVGTPCIYNGVIYVTTQTGPNGKAMLFALDPINNLHELWRYTCLEKEIIYGSPIVHDSVVYFGTSAPWGGSRPGGGAGRLHAISTSTHQDLTGTNPVNVASTKYRVDAASPSVDVNKDRVYIGDISCYVTAINRITGAYKYEWFPNEQEGFYASIPILDGYLFQGSNRSWVWRFKDSGSSMSAFGSFPTTDPIFSTPAAYDHKLYVCTYSITGNGKVYCIKTDGATFDGSSKIWETASLGNGIIASPALSIPTGLLFIATYDAKIYALNAATGAIAWQYDMKTQGGRTDKAVITSSPAISRGGLYIVVEDGNKRYLYCFKQ